MVSFNRLNISTLYRIILVFFLHQTITWSQPVQVNLKKEYPILKVGNDVWIGTPNGLYQYNANYDSYKLFVIPGKEESQIRYMYYNNEWLWCVLDSGLAVLQVRLNQWMVFDRNTGLPSNFINNIAFQGNYVWLATDNGAARYDLLIEEWEKYGIAKGMPDSNIVKVIVKDDLVWFVTEKGFSEYDPHFEKWRHFTVHENENIRIYEAFLLNDNIWLLCNKGLIKFNPVLNNQIYFFSPSISSEGLKNVVYEESNIWLLSNVGLFYVQTESQVLKEFEGNNFFSGYSLSNFSMDSYEILLVTDKNILDWNRAAKTWKIVDYASGISDSIYTNTYVSGGMTFLINKKVVDYKLTSDGPWKKYNLSAKKSENTIRNKNPFKNLFDNEAGGNVALGNYSLKLDGTKTSYIYNKDFDGKITQGKRLDIKTQLSSGELRSIYGFYNNVDYSETMYGLRYKSIAPKDVLREINLGDFRKDPGSIPFGENASVFGANTWLQTGEKTERFKRSKYSFKAMTGQLRSEKTYEYYQGANDKFNFSVEDINYIRNVFYKIPGLPSGEIPEVIELYLDDGFTSNNNGNTLIQTTIAGITGDFDLLHSNEDYYFHKKFSVIKMNKVVTSNQTLVIRYKLQGQSFEKVLQTNGLSSVAKNIYSLNANYIIPNSLNVRIENNQKEIQNLSDFGLGGSEASKIDPEWVDYENGFLIFPQSSPFPIHVYDSTRQSSYRIIFEYETKRFLVQLKHKDLVRGTEIVKLDGIDAIQGSDYVLDYTIGTLVFVKEGVVNLDTRIEIEYEYYLNSENNFIHGAYFNFSPSDNFYLQADWLNFKKAGIDRVDSASNLVTLHSEIRKKIGKEADMKLITGLAYQAEVKNLTGEYAEGLLSTSKFRFQTKAENYDKNYSNLYEHQSLIGKTKNNIQLSSSADPLSYLKLTGAWNRTEAFGKDSLKKPFNNQYNFSILLHKANLPSWQIIYQNMVTSTDSGIVNKRFINNQLEYQLPDFIVKKILIKSLKLEASFKQGKQSGTTMLGCKNVMFNQLYFKANSNFTDQIIGSFFYRRNDYYDDSISAGKNRLSRNDRVLLTFSQEQWRVMQVNLTIENTLEQNSLPNSETNSALLSKYSQINVRFSPGQIWDKLNPLFFEFNLSQNAKSWGDFNKPVSGYLWDVFTNRNLLFDYSTFSTDYYIKNELRPNSKIILYSLIEWNFLNNKNSASILNTNFTQWNEKLEIKLMYNLRLILQYKQFFRDNDYFRIYRYYEPATLVEHRWTSNLQDMINLQYRISTTGLNDILSNSKNLLFTYNVIWRKEKFLHLDRLEIRNDISGNLARSTGETVSRVSLYSINTAIDIYPFTSVIFRFQVQYRQNNDMLITDNSTSGFSYNLRVIMKF
jgi:hypothetical protein